MDHPPADTADVSASVTAEVDVSNAQIRQLLQEAEARMQRKADEAAEALKSRGRAASTVAHGRHSREQQPPRLPRLSSKELAAPYLDRRRDVARVIPSKLIPPQLRAVSGFPRKVDDPVMAKQRAKKEKEATAGSDWFNLPRTDMTPELKRDLQLLRMRSVLDPKRHYKKENGKAEAPKYSQVGTIIEGATEFYSARLPRKERKKTLVDEILSNEPSVARFDSKYEDVQVAKTSGKKAHYKNLKARRSKK